MKQPGPGDATRIDPALRDMFSYVMLLAAEGLSRDRREDAIWQNEVSMTLDRLSARACAGVSAVAEEFRLDCAEERELRRQEIARLQTEIALIRERSELLQIQIAKAEAERQALRQRLEDLAERIEAFYVSYTSRRQAPQQWFPFPFPGSAP